MKVKKKKANKKEEQASVMKTVRVLTGPSSQRVNTKDHYFTLVPFETKIKALKHKMETNSDMHMDL
jgi:hypothetical protein